MDPGGLGTIVRLGGNSARGGQRSRGSWPSPVQVTALGTGIVEVSAGGHHTCARQGDGTLRCWGRNSDGQVGDGTKQGSYCVGVLDVCRLSPVQVALTCP